MKTSIATVSLSGDLAEKLAAIAAAGFDGVEIFENDFLSFDGSPRDVGRMVADHGLAITLFQPFRDFEGLPEPQRSRAFERAERKFDVMGELGTDMMLVCSNVSPIALGGIDRAAADLNALGERAARRGLRIGYEALAWGRYVNDHRDAWEIVRRADHPAVGLVLDSFHTLARGIDVDSIRSIPGERIFMVQLADAPRLAMDLMSWGRHFRTMPGQGDLPLLDFMRAVAATGYGGYFSLEVFNDQFRAGSPRRIATDGRRSLLFLADQLRRADPGLALDAPAMPPRVAAEGVEFIEFAVDEAEAEALGRLFRAMGFVKGGVHKSKEVTVWRQGRVNLVINTEKEGFAHASYLVHGASVCAIGLKVENAAAAVERARILGAEPFEQAVGPGELVIPAVRGVGGGVIYFLDGVSALGRVWEIEFDPIEDADRAEPAGIVAVDHIAQTMNYEEMLTWLLFYTSILKMRKTPMIDIVDPAGLVRSQVVESDDRSVRITMNGAESHRTLAGRFIADSFGSSVQHVALRTNDIAAAARALASNGFASLAIPRNYYDDLEARYGLDPAMTAWMRDNHILYERDEAGEYFQLYSQAFGDGFFFEIVERRGYDGYGATNAPIRIAAQRREARPEGVPRPLRPVAD